MAFKEYNTDIGVQGKISLTTVPNKAGTLLTYGSGGDISTRTNAQIISDLGLISATNIASSYYTKIQLQTSGQSQVHWGNITSKPNTVEGYGITDAHKVDRTGGLNNVSDTHRNQSWFDYSWADTGKLGSAISFGGLNNLYNTEFFGRYNGGGNEFGARTRNGDENVWNPIRWFWHSGNFNPANYVPYTGATQQLNLGGNNLVANTGVFKNILIDNQEAYGSISFARNGPLRWFFTLDPTPEDGNDNGSELSIYRYNNNGDFLGRAMGISRSTGDVTFENRVTAQHSVVAGGVALGEAIGKLRWTKQSSGTLGALAEDNGWANIQGGVIYTANHGDSSQWNTAYNNNHTHSNKAQLDNINQNLGTSHTPTFNGAIFTDTVNAKKIVVYSSGNDYTSGGIEIQGNGTVNTVFPGIGFHQSGLYASSLQLRGDSDFRFYANGGVNYANVTANSFIKSGGTPYQFLKADGSVDTKTYLTSSDLIVGGRNYIKTSQAIDMSGNSAGAGVTTVRNDEDTKYNRTIGDTLVSTYGQDGTSTDYAFVKPMVTGQTYTVSVEVRIPVAGNVGFYNSGFSRPVTEINKWVRISGTYFYTEGTRVLGLSYQASNTIDSRNWKIEKGNVATDWTPAPEDLVSDWGSTDADSLSFIKNKPDLLSEIPVYAGNQRGLVPDRDWTPKGQVITDTKYLCEDGSWKIPPNDLLYYAAGVGLDLSGNTFSLKEATATGLGGVKLGHPTTQTIGTVNPTSVAGRTYPVQRNSNGAIVVNIPWSDTTYTLASLGGEPAFSVLPVIKGGTGVSGLTNGYVKASGGAPFSTVPKIPYQDVEGMPYASNRDFPLGTLITTSIDYSSENGDPFLLEIKGNTYDSGIPLDIKVQGYIYYNSLINYYGITNSSILMSITALNVGGKLCFWFPRLGYWQGYVVNCIVAYGGYQSNKVTSITDSADPGGTKRVQIPFHRILNTSNFGKYNDWRDSIDTRERFVINEMAWRNYGNGHTITDVSSGLSPSGGAVNRFNADIPWEESYPMLVGWNGSYTYGVKVDSARIADTIVGIENYLKTSYLQSKPILDANIITKGTETNYFVGVNGPPTATDGNIITTAYSESFANQIYMNWANQMYFRTKSNGVWADWKEVWTTQNLPKSAIDYWNNLESWTNNNFSKLSHNHQILYDSGYESGNSTSLDTLGNTSNFIIHQRVQTGTPSLFPNTNNANALMSIGTHPGFSQQIGFSSDGNLYRRSMNSNIWETTWKKIYDTGNFNPASYLPLSGGTMAGTIKFPTNIEVQIDGGSYKIGKLDTYGSDSGLYGLNNTILAVDTPTEYILAGESIFVDKATLNITTTSMGSTSLGITQTSGAGAGVSLYAGATGGAMPNYGLAFAGTGTFGTHGQTNGDWATYFTMDGSSNRGWIFKSGNTAGGNVASISASGFATFNGSVTATSFYESSLRKLKENIQPFEQSGVELIKELDIVTYDRIDGTKDKIGIIADDTRKEFLSEKMSEVDLYKTIFIQAKAIQELTARIEALENGR